MAEQQSYKDMKNFKDDVWVDGHLCFIQREGDIPIRYSTDQLTEKYLEQKTGLDVCQLNLISTVKVLMESI